MSWLRGCPTDSSPIPVPVGVPRCRTDKGLSAGTCRSLDPGLSPRLTCLPVSCIPGTYDAISLSSTPLPPSNLPPAELYPLKLAPLVKPGGFFLITSCNFTEEEVRARFEGAGVGTYDFGLVWNDRRGARG